MNNLKLFISNIPYGWNNDDLQTLANNALTSINIKRDENGRSRGHGYVVCESNEAMQQMLAMNGAVFGGSSVKEIALRVQPWREIIKEVKPC